MFHDDGTKQCHVPRRRAGHTYGKLAPQAINSAAAADGEANFGTADKRDASDFALWKAAKAGEPAWASPECARGADGALGSGRPGGPSLLLLSQADTLSAPFCQLPAVTTHWRYSSWQLILWGSAWTAWTAPTEHQCMHLA